MKVCIRTVGCRTNKADSGEMARALVQGGAQIVEEPEDADWVVVNSCTVTRAADRDSRREAYRARRSSSDPQVLVVGCMPAASGTEGDWADARTTLIASRDEAVRRILVAVGGGSGPGSATAMAMATSRATSTSTGIRRHYIKVQEGCDQRCRYCIVPDARGSARSVPEREVLGEVVRAAEAGYRDVVLTGTHVGRWGEDLVPARDLAHLMSRITESAEPRTRYRLSSLEPQDCSPAILEALRPPFCPHLHLPLQAGTDETLGRMGRPYTTRDFAALVDDARARLGTNLCVGADVITGFPGESDAAFEDGLEFIRGLDLSYLHVFTYSPRPGTPAAAYRDRISPGVAKARTRIMRDLGEEKRDAFARSLIGTTLAAFVEGPAGEAGKVLALTENFLRATLTAEISTPGTWVSIRVDGAGDGIVSGAIHPPCV